MSSNVERLTVTLTPEMAHAVRELSIQGPRLQTAGVIHHAKPCGIGAVQAPYAGKLTVLSYAPKFRPIPMNH